MPAEDNPPPSDNKPITDFGEKLEGAKKDLWVNYKKSMTEALPTDAKEITLSKYFPEPDYENLIASGLDIRAIAAIKAMRDEIHALGIASQKNAIGVNAIRFIDALQHKAYKPLLYGLAKACKSHFKCEQTMMLKLCKQIIYESAFSFCTSAVR